MSKGWTSDPLAKDHETAVRAYRQLAAQLRSQGISEVADRFSYRSQIRQRKLLFHRQLLEDLRHPWRLPGDLLRWLFSGFLALLAGYGYRPGPHTRWYLAVIAGFSFAYFQATHGLLTFGLHPLQVPPLQSFKSPCAQRQRLSRSWLLPAGAEPG